MPSFVVVSRNGIEQAVAYPEGVYPTVEEAIAAARALRIAHPPASRLVREGWFTAIEVVEADGAVFGPRLFRF
jgi:hypothetical protein